MCGSGRWLQTDFFRFHLHAYLWAENSQKVVIHAWKIFRKYSKICFGHLRNSVFSGIIGWFSIFFIFMIPWIFAWKIVWRSLSRVLHGRKTKKCTAKMSLKSRKFYVCSWKNCAAWKNSKKIASTFPLHEKLLALETQDLCSTICNAQWVML